MAKLLTLFAIVLIFCVHAEEEQEFREIPKVIKRWNCVKDYP